MTTVYFLNCIAGNVFGSASVPSIPSAYYIGLSTTQPNANGTNVTEPASAGGYARVRLNSIGNPQNGAVTNTSAISFNESTSSWGVVTHFVVYDAATGGNLLMYGELTSPRTVDAATTIAIKPGDLSLTVQNHS